MADKLKKFQALLKQSKNIIVLSGAGVSAESGIPVFRGAGGLWRSFRAEEIATPFAFTNNPSLVWEFYHYRRGVAFNAEPNKAHLALAKFEKNCNEEGRKFNIITQNVDGLHQRAGSKNVLELHGALREVICTKCKQIEIDTNHPICFSLKNRGDPKARNLPPIPISFLPSCKSCGGLLRPNVVWFGEQIDLNTLDTAKSLVDTCDLCLVVGTSSVVYPAAMFAPSIFKRGQTVAEFNIDKEKSPSSFQFYFEGPCGITIPEALNVEV